MEHLFELKSITTRRKSFLLAVVILMVLVTPALAQSGGPYALTWFTVDGGGGESVASPYTLNGTIGQPDPGAPRGGGYTLEGGFWGGKLYGRMSVYLPLILRY